MSWPQTGGRVPGLDDAASRLVQRGRERFEARRGAAGSPEECWLWPGPYNQRGYGRRSGIYGEPLAHRGAWRLAHDMTPIPYGYHVDHICGVKACVNPAHLRMISAAEHGEAHGRPWMGRFTQAKWF